MVVRPAGSAVVELDQPTSKTQKGPALIQPLFQQFEATPTLPPQVATSPSSNNDETVVVENPELRNLAIQNQFTNQNQFQDQNQFQNQNQVRFNRCPFYLQKFIDGFCCRSAQSRHFPHKEGLI